jgi:hypothetical protein
VAVHSCPIVESGECKIIILAITVRVRVNIRRNTHNEKRQKHKREGKVFCLTYCRVFRGVLQTGFGFTDHLYTPSELQVITAPLLISAIQRPT